MMKIVGRLFLLPTFALTVVLMTAVITTAQSQDTGPQPPSPAQDPIAQLNLTPEQRQQIRAIREQNKEERALVNRRLRETKLALEQALDADTPNESLIEQRAREAGEAESASIRLRALTESRIRRVLTVEQVKTFRALRAQAQGFRREQRLENQSNPPRRRGLNQRNGVIRQNLLRKRP
jgi:Spy/CpxP family protein refolding chaperone